MNIKHSEAIILHTRDYGESDRLIAFYTLAGGRLKGIAKGARRSQKRFVHAFEPCSLVDLTYRERKSLAWIDGCKLLEPHLALRTDIERWGCAALVSEIVMEMVPEGEPQEELFVLFKESLQQLTGDRDPFNVVLLFLFRFLDITGYLPSLESCSVCRRPLRSATRWSWRLDQGTLACPEHCQVHAEHLVLDLGTLVLIQQLRKLPVSRIWRLRIVQEKRARLLRGLVGWVCDHIRKDLKSLKLLGQIQAAERIGEPVLTGPETRSCGYSTP